MSVRVLFAAALVLILALALAGTRADSPQLLSDQVYLASTLQDLVEQEFVYLVLVVGLPVHLRFRFVHALVALAPFAAVVVVLSLSLAETPLVYSGWGICFVLASCVVTVLTCFLRERADRALYAARVAAQAAERDANELLQNLLPPQVVSRILAGREVQSQVHEDCAILFLDLAGFTRMAADMDPVALMAVLNTLYSRFDDMVERRGLWKAETVGDAYIVVGGLFAADEEEAGRAPPTSGEESPRRQHILRAGARVRAVLDLGLAMQRALAAFRAETQYDIHMRVGVHVGAVTTAIVGSLRPRFGVFGLPMLVAEKLEGMAASDSVLCSSAVHRAYTAALSPAEREEGGGDASALRFSKLGSAGTESIDGPASAAVAAAAAGSASIRMSPLRLPLRTTS